MSGCSSTKSFPLLNALALVAALSVGCGVEPGEWAEQEPELATSAPQALVGFGPITGLGGRCVDVFEQSTNDGTTIHMWDCHGQASQLWRAFAPNEWGEIRGALGAQDKCLDAEGGATADGTRVQLWPCNGTAAQRWRPTSSGKILGNGGKCLTVSGTSSQQPANGQQLVLATCSVWEGDAQRFTVGVQVSLQLWASDQGAFWDEQKWMTGDFNGDGRTDVAKAWNDGDHGTIDVHLSTRDASTGTYSFSMQRWATQQGLYWDEQKWMAGDFNGDGRTDMAKVWNDGGRATIDVHLSTRDASTGTYSFSMQRWATRQGDYWDQQQWVAGDFDGDKMTDMAKVWNDGGRATIDVHLSSGAEGAFGGFFEMHRWATQLGGFWNEQKWMAGDFNGDGRTDLGKAWNHDGRASIDVHYSFELSYGGAFYISRWATQWGHFSDDQRWIVGDVNGDGMADMVKTWKERDEPCYYINATCGGTASIEIYLSSQWAFSMQRWATKFGAFWDEDTWMAGDFNGDGKADIARASQSGGGTNIHVYQ